MSDLNKLKELVKLHTREFDLHKADPRSPSKLAAWDYASSLLNDEIDRDAVGLVTQILGGLEAAQQRIVELEEGLALVREQRDAELNASSRLEAEIARRDAAAGEPFGYLRVVSGSSFQIMEGVNRPPDRSGNGAGPWFPIFTAAQPSALPPEATLDDGPFSDKNGDYQRTWVSGANWMREQVKALGCKAIKLPEPKDGEPRMHVKPDEVETPSAISRGQFQYALNALNDCLMDCGDSEQGLRLALTAAGVSEKVIKLPKPDVYECNGTRFYDRLNEEEVIAALRAQGFTVEGE